MALNTSRPTQPWLPGAVLGPCLPVWGRGWSDRLCLGWEAVGLNGPWGRGISVWAQGRGQVEYCDFNSDPEAEQVTLVQSSAVDVCAWVTAQPGCQCFFIDSVVEEYFSC